MILERINNSDGELSSYSESKKNKLAKKLVKKARGDIDYYWLCNQQSRWNVTNYIHDGVLLDHLNRNEQPHYIVHSPDTGGGLGSSKIEIEEQSGNSRTLKGYYNLNWFVITDKRILIVIGGGNTLNKKIDDKELSVAYDEISEFKYDNQWLGFRTIQGAELEFRADLSNVDVSGLESYVKRCIRAESLLTEARKFVEQIDPATDFNEADIIDKLIETRAELDSIVASDELESERISSVDSVKQSIRAVLYEAFKSQVAQAERAAESRDYDRAASLTRLTISRIDALTNNESVREFAATAYRIRVSASALAGNLSEAIEATERVADGNTSYDIDKHTVLSEALSEVAAVSETAACELVRKLLATEAARSGSPRRSLAVALGTFARDRPEAVPRTHIPTVVGLLQADDAALRQSGCQILAVVGKESELADLRNLKEDPTYEVRVAALRAMETVADREGVSLTDSEREAVANIEHQGEGDVVVGEQRQTDVTTTVEDSVINRSTVGGNVEKVTFCPNCGKNVSNYSAASFCPFCGAEL